MKAPSLEVTVRSPKSDKHGSHPLVEYNMPVLAPGERLPKNIPFKMPQSVIDKLNKPGKKKIRFRRRKPKFHRRRHKKKKEIKRKIIGYHKICLKWIVGVIVNRHFKNNKEWKYKDAIFDSDGKFRYCKQWGKLPIYEPLLKSAKKRKNREKYLKKLSHDIELFCKNKLFVILNLSGTQRTYWADKIQKQCEMSKLKEMIKKQKKQQARAQMKALKKKQRFKKSQKIIL